MPPEMGKYLKPSRVPYEESSCYSKINFSCPDNVKGTFIIWHTVKRYVLDNILRCRY